MKYNLLLPKVPNYWLEREPIKWPPGSDHIAGRVFEHRLIGLRVIRSVSTDMQNQKWLHVSLSRPDRLPTWAELSKIKEEFIGDHTAAYHVIPSKADHINVHAYCMHLWSPLDGLQRLPNMQDLTLEEAI